MNISSRENLPFELHSIKKLPNLAIKKNFNVSFLKKELNNFSKKTQFGKFLEVSLLQSYSTGFLLRIGRTISRLKKWKFSPASFSVKQLAKIG